MSDKVGVVAVHTRYKGVFDFQALWKLIADWFESKGYEVMEDKVKSAGGAFGETTETQMTAIRNVTDYYRFQMQCYQKLWDGTYVEVVKNGKKQKLLKARIYIRVSGDVIRDYADRYEHNKFTQGLKKFMDNHVLKWQLDVIYGDQLFYKVHELQNVIKEFLHMEVTGSEFADMW